MSTNNITPLRSNGQQDDDDFNIPYHDLNDIYYSSDEDDEPSNFEFLNDMSDYEPGKIQFNQLRPIISKVPIIRRFVLFKLNNYFYSIYLYQ